MKLHQKGDHSKQVTGLTKHTWIPWNGLKSQKRCAVCGCICKGITENRVTRFVYILRGEELSARPDCIKREEND